jgi:hypothetical protein
VANCPAEHEFYRRLERRQTYQLQIKMQGKNEKTTMVLANVADLTGVVPNL